MISWKTDRRYFNPAYWSSIVAIASFLVLFVTGIALAAWYYPTPSLAYDSIIFIQKNVYFGELLLSLHHWATHLLIISIIAHMIRVYFSKGKFEEIWRFGFFLLVISILFIYTGYLLRWDDVGYWSIEVTSSIFRYIPKVGQFIQFIILGGKKISQITLLRFYFAHISLLPLLSVSFLAYHYYKIGKKKISWAEIGVSMITIGFLLCISVIYPFSLTHKVSLQLNFKLKPFWLFLWLYAIERGIGKINPKLNFIVPLSLFLALLFTYYLPKIEKKYGIVIFLILIILSIIGLYE